MYAPVIRFQNLESKPVNFHLLAFFRHVFKLINDQSADGVKLVVVKAGRSRRKLQKLDKNAVKVDIADGRATFQMILPMNALMAEVAGSIEQMSSQAGLLMMKAMID